MQDARVLDKFKSFPQASDPVNNLAVRLRRDPISFPLVLSSPQQPHWASMFELGGGGAQWSGQEHNSVHKTVDRRQGSAEVRPVVNQEQVGGIFLAASELRRQACAQRRPAEQAGIVCWGNACSANLRCVGSR